jgi:hypothetical protein
MLALFIFNTQSKNALGTNQLSKKTSFLHFSRVHSIPSAGD